MPFAGSMDAGVDGAPGSGGAGGAGATGWCCEHVQFGSICKRFLQLE